MTTNAREYVSKFQQKKFFIGFVISEAPGTVEGYYSNGDKKIKLSGVAIIEPQRQVSILGHNKLKIDFLKPPEGVGVIFDFESHLLKKKIFMKIKLAPKPNFKINLKKINIEKLNISN